jgi:hypothetical protein
MYLELLKSQAVVRRLMKPEAQIDLKRAFTLVRDMPYKRASSRDPEITIQEWRGTCSGKHYLLKQLFEELGYTSKMIVCTTVEHIDPKEVRGKLRTLLKQSNGRFVDVHNYLILDYPGGQMIVDATWPISTGGMGTVVNESFVLGEDHQIACEPLQTWEVPPDQDPQTFKQKILEESFTDGELKHREEFILALGQMTNSPWVRFLLKLERLIQGKSG